MALAREAFAATLLDAPDDDPDPRTAEIIYLLSPKPSTAPAAPPIAEPAKPDDPRPRYSSAYLKRIEDACATYAEGKDLLALLNAGESGRVDYALLVAYEQTKDPVFYRLREDFWKEIPQSCSPYLPPGPLQPRRRSVFGRRSLI